jgi:hypothetical protein
VKAALLALSLLGQPPVPVSDRVPVVDVEALCSDVSAGDKASGLASDASACASDEKAAQQQLESIWATVPAAPRDSCESLAMSGGGRSYVDLLTCLQMAGWVKPAAPDAAPLKGASKDRNIKK